MKYSKVFPLSETLGFKIPSKYYRRVVGGLEVICGALLAFSWNGTFSIVYKSTSEAYAVLLVNLMW